MADYTLKQKLHVAIFWQADEQLQQLLVHDLVDVNAVEDGPPGRRPLEYAALWCNLQAMDYLISYGACIDRLLDVSPIFTHIVGAADGTIEAPMDAADLSVRSSTLGRFLLLRRGMRSSRTGRHRRMPSVIW